MKKSRIAFITGVCFLTVLSGVSVQAEEKKEREAQEMKMARLHGLLAELSIDDLREGAYEADGLALFLWGLSSGDYYKSINHGKIKVEGRVSFVDMYARSLRFLPPGQPCGCKLYLDARNVSEDDRKDFAGWIGSYPGFALTGSYGVEYPVSEKLPGILARMNEDLGSRGWAGDLMFQTIEIEPKSPAVKHMLEAEIPLEKMGGLISAEIQKRTTKL